MKRLLKLAFSTGGVPYHECVVSPREAKSMLGGKPWSKLILDHREYGFTCLSYAAIARVKIGAKVRFIIDGKDHECLITIEPPAGSSKNAESA